MRVRLSPLIVSTAFTIVACSDGTSPDRNDDVSLEEVLSELNTVGVYAGAGLAPSGVGMTGVSAPSPEACPFDSTTEYFICPERTHDGLTFNRRYQLLDGNASPLPSFDPGTVSGIRNVTDMEGTLQVPRLNGSTSTYVIDLHDEQTLIGLRTSTRTVNGSGTSEITATHDGQTRTTSSTRTTENLVLPSTPGPGVYPVSGTITNAATSEGMTFSSTMTFNGTSTVTIVTTMNGQTQTCTYDLANRMSPPVCS